MAKEPIIAARAKTPQPDANSTRKDQKGYRLPDEYDPVATNAELDRLHERLNKIVVEAEALADLDPSTATTSEIATRLNAYGEILRSSGLLRRT